MKKLFKPIIFAILIFAISLTPSLGFAAEIGDSIIYDSDYFYTSEYIYSGDLKEGVEECSFTSDNHSFVFEFTAEKAGYYSFSESCEYRNSSFLAEKLENGTISNIKDTVGYGEFPEIQMDWSTDYPTLGIIGYLDTDETVYFAYSIYNIYDDVIMDGSSIINVEYLGELTSYEIPEEKASEIIIDNDIYCRENDEGTYDYTFTHTTTLTFSNGKKFTSHAIEAMGVEDIKTGSNTVTANIFGEEKEITFNAVEADDYIKSISSDDDLWLRKYFDGETAYTENKEKITVEFANGEKKNIGNSVVAPNGFEYEVRTTVTDAEESGMSKITVSVCGRSESFYAFCKPVSFNENLKHLTERLDHDFSWFADRAKVLTNITDIKDIPVCVKNVIRDFKYVTESSFELISEFVNYCYVFYL